MRALAVFAPLLVMSALSSQETQTVRLEPQADRSVAVVFVVDLTRASWPLERTDALREGMRAAMVEHLGSADLVGIAGVAAEIRTDGALVRGIQRLDARLDHALAVPLPDRFGTCRIWDGVDRAVTMLASAPREARRLIVLFTAARATGNVARVDTVIARARGARVSVSAVFRPTHLYRFPFEQSSGEKVWFRPELALDQLVRQTGGQGVQVDGSHADGLSGAFGALFAGG